VTLKQFHNHFYHFRARLPTFAYARIAVITIAVVVAEAVVEEVVVAAAVVEEEAGTTATG